MLISKRIVKGDVRYPSAMPAEAKDLIGKLLQLDPSRRFGNQRGGARDVKSHPWFKQIDWIALYKRELEPPIKPHLTSKYET